MPKSTYGPWGEALIESPQQQQRPYPKHISRLPSSRQGRSSQQNPRRATPKTQHSQRGASYPGAHSDDLEPLFRFFAKDGSYFEVIPLSARGAAIPCVIDRVTATGQVVTNVTGTRYKGIEAAKKAARETRDAYNAMPTATNT